MTTIHCTCNYCDHKWTTQYQYQVDSCIKCKSKKPKLKRVEEGDKIDYYAGSPPFPPKKQESDMYDLAGY